MTMLQNLTTGLRPDEFLLNMLVNAMELPVSEVTIAMNSYIGSPEGMWYG